MSPQSCISARTDEGRPTCISVNVPNFTQSVRSEAGNTAKPSLPKPGATDLSVLGSPCVKRLALIASAPVRWAARTDSPALPSVQDSTMRGQGITAHGQARRRFLMNKCLGLRVTLLDQRIQAAPCGVQSSHADGFCTIHCRRSSMRRATSSCNQGDRVAGTQAQRAAATGLMVGGLWVVMGRKSKAGRVYWAECFSAWARGLSRAVPSTCAVCHAWPAQAVCEDHTGIWSTGPPLPDLRISPSGHSRFNVARAPTRHRRGTGILGSRWTTPTRWTGLIAHFKFQENPAWGGHFATLMRSAPWVEPALEAADFVIPMPLARERLLQRGFNDSASLRARPQP